MTNLSTNETLILHAVTGILILIGFMLGMFIERRKWVKIFRAAVAYRKGLIDLSTTRVFDTLGRMGFTTAEAAKGLEDLGKGVRSVYPKQGFPPIPLPPRPPRGGYTAPIVRSK